MKKTYLIIAAVLILILAVLQISHVLNFNGLWLTVAAFALIFFAKYASSKDKKVASDV